MVSRSALSRLGNDFQKTRKLRSQNLEIICYRHIMIALRTGLPCIQAFRRKFELSSKVVRGNPEDAEITENTYRPSTSMLPLCASVRPPVRVRYDLHYSFLKAETTFGEGRSGLYLFPLFRHKKRGTSEERVSEQRSCNVETGNALASTDNCSDDDSARAANDRMKAAAGPGRKIQLF